MVVEMVKHYLQAANSTLPSKNDLLEDKYDLKQGSFRPILQFFLFSRLCDAHKDNPCSRSSRSSIGRRATCTLKKEG